jgi:hypothetical protein
MIIQWNTNTGNFPDAKRKIYTKVYRLNRIPIVKKLKISITDNPISRDRYYLTDSFWEYCENQIHCGGGGYRKSPYFTYDAAHIPKKYER